MAYTSATDLKTYLGITAASDDTLLGTLIAQAQKAIDSFCRRTFEASADSTRYFDAVADVSPDRLTLYLDEDLCAATTVTNGDSTVVVAGNRVFEPRNRTPYYAIKIKPSSGLVWTYTTDPENAISIAGKWAFSTTAPSDIVQATLRLAAWFYRQRDTSNDTFSSAILTPSGVTILPADMPKDVQAILKQYVRLTP